jgi:hypothetical protein
MTSDELRSQRDDLEKSIDSLRVWMIVFTGVVVSGLFIELRPAIKLIIAQNWWGLLDLLGTFVVAIGVAGEFCVEFNAHTKELRLRVLNADIETDYQSKLAEANKQIAQAKLDTERIRESVSPRVLDGGHLSVIGAKLIEHPGAVWIEFLLGDFESQQFATQLFALFRLSGWHAGLRGISTTNLRYGLIIPRGGSDSSPDVAAVHAAFCDSGLKFIDANYDYETHMSIDVEDGPNECDARIFVGPKPLLLPKR